MSNNIHILIVEDDKFESEILKGYLEEHNFKVYQANTLSNALILFTAKKIDFVIIDVFLDGKPEGITLAQTLSKDKIQPIPFMFLTGSTERSVFEKAKFTQPYGFLIKPFNQMELIYTIELILEKYHSDEKSIENLNRPFFLKKNNRFFKIELNDIKYVQVEGRYCNIYTETNTFLVQNSLADFHKTLPQDLFSRTHRNFIVNSSIVREVHYDDNLIILQNNQKIPLGRAYKANFFKNYKIIK